MTNQEQLVEELRRSIEQEPPKLLELREPDITDVLNHSFRWSK